MFLYIEDNIKMANEVSNYDVILKRDSVTIAGVVSLDFPEITNEAVGVSVLNGTSKVYVAGGMVDISDFGATIIFDAVEAGSFYGALISGTVNSYAIEFPNAVEWTFNGVVTSFQPETADSDSPEVLQANVKFQPTGLPVIS
jgi:hypothetical protein